MLSLKTISQATLSSMRYFFILLFFFSFTFSKAQSFEGIIKWSIKADIPALAKHEAQDGTNKEAIAALQKKMADPAFQKQMEQNPEIKKMLEEQLKKAEIGSTIASFIPTGMVVKIKNGNSLTKMIGGPETEILHLKDKAYMLNRKEKMYSIAPEYKAKEEDLDKIKVTPTNATAKILNHTCKKYIVEDANGLKTTVWATNEIKNIDIQSFYQSKDMNNQYFSKIEGFPLKIESENKGNQFTLEVTEISKTPQKAEDFKIPADFKEKRF